MEQTKPDIPQLESGEKILGIAYLTPDEEVIFTPHSGAIEVLLVEPRSGASGPWAIRLRPPIKAPLARAAGA